MAKPQKSTAQSEVPGLVKKGPLYYLKRDWQLYALMLLPMVFIIVFKYFAYTGLSVAFLDYKIGKGYAGSKFVGLKIFEKVFKHRDFTKAVVNTLLLNVLDLIFSFPMPIILALLLNEIRVKWFKRTTQEAYVDCVTCSPDEFESKYEEYCQEYLDAGYQEILDEKASLIADGNVLVVK